MGSECLKVYGFILTKKKKKMPNKETEKLLSLSYGMHIACDTAKVTQR